MQSEIKEKSGKLVIIVLQVRSYASFKKYKNISTHTCTCIPLEMLRQTCERNNEDVRYCTRVLNFKFPFPSSNKTKSNVMSNKKAQVSFED